jgi:hypothetical protein
MLHPVEAWDLLQTCTSVLNPISVKELLSQGCCGAILPVLLHE